VVRKFIKYKWKDRQHHFLINRLKDDVWKAWLFPETPVTDFYFPYSETGHSDHPSSERALKGIAGTTNPAN